MRLGKEQETVRRQPLWEARMGNVFTTKGQGIVRIRHPVLTTGLMTSSDEKVLS